MKLDPADFPGLSKFEVERLERMAVAAGKELRGYQLKHNHFTRDLKPKGSSCLACNAHHIAEEVLMAAASVCPECRDGKHGNCVGYALNPATDVVVDCECTHSDR